jgi:REP element-mobilizing transposase RayT
MAQSLSKIYLHIIFHIKSTSPRIDDIHIERVHQYIGQLVHTVGCKAIVVGGVSDHIHVLCTLGRDVCVTHLIEEVKRNSSRWIKALSPVYDGFAWQGGYGVFSVSQSVVETTRAYIMQQAEHHRRRSFQDEYRDFLNLYQIAFDERYVFTD